MRFFLILIHVFLCILCIIFLCIVRKLSINFYNTPLSLTVAN